MSLPMYTSLSWKRRLELACEVINGQLEQDDCGQFIIYTGLTEDENGEIIVMPEEP